MRSSAANAPIVPVIAAAAATSPPRIPPPSPPTSPPPPPPPAPATQEAPKQPRPTWPSASSLWSSLPATRHQQPATPQRQKPQPPVAAELSYKLFPASLTGTRRSSIVRTVFASAALAEEELKRAEAAGENRPSLNLLTTTPYNTFRFILRFGPVVNSKDVIVDVLAWKDPLVSGICLGSYVVLCLYPTLVLILPQIVVIAFITFNYHLRNYPVPPQAGAPVPGMAEVAVLADGATATDSAELETLYSRMSGLAKSQYAKNLQFLQNLMGSYCDVYDQIEENAEYVDWTDPVKTKQTLYASLVGIPAALAVYQLVPLNWAMLVAGSVVFLKGTPVWDAVVVGIPTMLRDKSYSLVAAVVRAIPIPDAIGGVGSTSPMRPTTTTTTAAAAITAAQDATATAEIFENQRWWAGPGWTPHLLQGERDAFSDASGAAVARPTSDAEPPAGRGPGWAWSDAAWTVDFAWARTDAEGWVYSDHQWGAPSDRQGVAALTRRRRWVRKMQQVAAAGGGAADAEGRVGSGAPASSAVAADRRRSWVSGALRHRSTVSGGGGAAAAAVDLKGKKKAE
ncbi:integral peroxisomal membrane peroxin-domain-containing protein [Zopfochytrium polystomum]|nr:integral peroxisomal membrane peroxin-domain-containing protein [Zopfochytrium polystomum]